MLYLNLFACAVDVIASNLTLTNVVFELSFNFDAKDEIRI